MNEPAIELSLLPLRTLLFILDEHDADNRFKGDDSLLHEFSYLGRLSSGLLLGRSFLGHGRPRRLSSLAKFALASRVDVSEGTFS